MRLRKLIFTLFVIFLGWNRVWAVAPSWTVQTENYQYNMTVVSALFIEGEFSADPNDVLAVFVNDECRGVAHPVYDANTQKYVVYLMMFSNAASGESMDFKIYDASEDQVFLLQSSITFSNNANIGTSQNPFLAATNYAPENLVLSNNTVVENQAGSTFIGNLSATDADGNSLVFSLVNGFGDNSAFHVNGTVLESGQPFDFEEQESYSIQVLVEDGHNGSLPETFSIVVEDVNEAPVIASGQTFEVADESLAGTPLGQLEISDDDPNQEHAYVIESGNTGGVFEIQPSGSIVVASGKKADYEQRATYELSIRVTDNGVPAMEDVETVRISVLDKNFTPTAIHLSGNRVDENLPANTLVGALTADDVEVEETFTYSLPDEVQGHEDFKIVGDQLITARAFDYEAQAVYNKRILVTDSKGAQYTQVMEIEITDLNESPVIAEQQFSIVENSPLGTFVGYVVFSDEEQNQTHTFLIIAGNTNVAFKLDKETGELTINNASQIDYEKVREYAVTIQVTDSKGAIAQKEYLIQITDVNEAPEIEDQYFSIDEELAEETVIGYIEASDVDYGQTLNFAIMSGNTLDGFQIDQATGKLSINNPAVFDFEGTREYQLEVQIQDDGNPKLTDLALITVGVRNENYAPYDIELSNSRFKEIEEGRKFVGTLTAFDIEPAETFSFALPADEHDNNDFVVSNDSLYAVCVADYEAKNSRVVTVEVVDSKNASFQKDFTIEVEDVNEQPVIVDQTFNLDENSLRNSVVGLVKATDPDETQYLSWMIIGGNESGAFSINATTGEITVANPYALDYETASSFTLAVEVADNGFPVLKNAAVIEISLNDQSEWVLDADNFFTPNGDGINDTWQLKTPGQVYGFRLIIFNTAGEIVYETKSYSNEWDGINHGKELAEGTYYYLFRNEDGSRTYKGFITLKR